MTAVQSHIIKIHCEDEKGLIHRITQALFALNLNIINNGEHVDRQTNHFFMRTEVEGAIESEVIHKALQAVLPNTIDLKVTTKQTKRLVVLVTKETHCIGDLLIRTTSEDMHGQIVAVIGNYPDLETLVTRFDIPYHSISHEGKSREQHEQEMIDRINAYAPDYIVLAKYMRILTPGFVEAFPNKIINIHHSFLPAFIGAKPYQQAYDRGVKIVGATAHFVNDQLDEGPIIAQGVTPVTHADSASDMALAGRDVEKVTLAKAVNCVLEDRVFVHENKTILFD